MPCSRSRGRRSPETDSVLITAHPARASASPSRASCARSRAWRGHFRGRGSPRRAPQPQRARGGAGERRTAQRRIARAARLPEPRRRRLRQCRIVLTIRWNPGAPTFGKPVLVLRRKTERPRASPPDWRSSSAPTRSASSPRRPASFGRAGPAAHGRRRESVRRRARLRAASPMSSRDGRMRSCDPVSDASSGRAS